MITKVKIPKMDANMVEATIGEWYFQEGDHVKKGDSLVDIITDKTTFEFQAPGSGELLQILAPENSILPSGYVIAFIGKKGEDIPDVEAENMALLEKFRQEQEQKILRSEKTGKNAGTPQPSKSKPGRIRATPSAKRLAKENGIDLEDVQRMFEAAVINEKLLTEYIQEMAK